MHSPFLVVWGFLGGDFLFVCLFGIFLNTEEIKPDVFLDLVSPLSSSDLRSHQYVWNHLPKIVNPCKKRILCPVLMPT